MIKDWVRYNDIEEKREGYYVSYSPVFTGEEFAVLKTHIYKSELVEDAKNIAEMELKCWIKRYPVPVMVLVKNLTDVDLGIKGLTGENYLLGYPTKDGVYHSWGDYPEDHKPNVNLSKDNLAEIYSNLPCKTSAQINEELGQKALEVKAARIVLVLWLCVIPSLIAYLGWSNPIVSSMAFGYSLYMAARKGLELWGVKHRSPQDIENEKEKQLKEHHHYHCKINPDAFLKLKAENFRKERTDEEKAKIESMHN
ncbi:hypothetical protein [Cobetia sp. QF-1]|uniref:hypothetical protein n=1 Tax=Cobetia sp. QF-1 TaxID=1969833 RepID=UPI000B544096|nr:hypothetical protein [Cobetia sp. QF-1]